MGPCDARPALSSPLSGPPLPSSQAQIRTGGEVRGLDQRGDPHPSRLGEADDGEWAPVASRGCPPTATPLLCAWQPASTQGKRAHELLVVAIGTRPREAVPVCGHPWGPLW